ncbi:protein-methionine-sulfoxide reductase catalytic subunit MsrP [Saccharospirillum salsuginis]|uniref:Protein-methionine-sulfoxide reductase catalytic subunit MsrP n=1 Tax=Saccharospirillum salsuginis TaxID=418750 RepID=A0A918NAQ5_9GAMM|nr:protein-methionine-sulfoxide reductase catalytic subunit MsrP [Saccharospirillum salsuginis]GGX54273.1 protein-methionine-sulfoxide reductase catalytic subunit MsrP [Saccharospirillum salsuginis]
MLIKRPTDLTENDVTPRQSYLNRRQIMQAAGGLALAGLVPGAFATPPAAPHWLAQKVENTLFRSVSTEDGLTEKADVTSYNNFYEFGTGKDDPAKYADEFNPYPWQIEVGGLCDKPGTLDLESLVSARQTEERIYRLRCVEAWSMVIPWVGIELGTLLKQFEPRSSAKYVAFQTLFRPEEMRGQKSRFSFIDYPYVEGLRMDEAMHRLSFLAIGMYGEPLPNQNGAPIRLVVPWKYGFKSIKSIVKIEFVEEEPPTTWNLASAREYGFYSNVNPNVDHPRWSQANERRIGPNGNIERIPTAMFNGYTEVASLYEGMDLRKFF